MSVTPNVKLSGAGGTTNERQEKLFEMSHEVILDLQEGRSEASRDAWIAFGKYSGGHYLSLVVLLFSPFLSRERFWYYVILLQVNEFFKGAPKTFLHESRPIWVYPDLSPVESCQWGFASPSGH